MKGSLRVLKFLIGWPLTILSFFFIGKFLLSNTSAILYALKNVNVFFLFVSLVFFLGYFFLRSFFWQKLLAYQNHILSFKEVTFFWGFSEAKRYVPGNIWSFLSRTTSFTQKGVSQHDVIQALFIEIESLILGSILVSLLSINFIFYGIFPSFWYKPLIIFIVVILSLFIVLFIIFNNFILRYIKTLNLPVGRFVLNIMKLSPHFSPYNNFLLLLLQTSALMCFGIGSYFAITSFLYLYPVHFLTFIGFFVFSFLVGYLSFITPMGLGVREAVITIGLQKYLLSFPLASFGAIISRIILVLSELIFLLFIFLWKRSKEKWIKKIEVFVQHHYAGIILALFIIVYCIYIITISILRYTNFYVGRFDLGNMDQVVWNTIRGRIFQITDPDGVNIISRLAIHADFILVFLAPFYLLWRDPRMLLIIQTLIVALGAVFVFLLGKDLLKNKTAALILSIAYLLNPSVEHSNLYDFHAVTLATTFLLGSFYFIRRKKYFLTILFLLLASITKEEVWIITAITGLYMFLAEKKRVLGTIVFLLSTFIFFYLVSYAIPHARGGQHFILSYYSDFGSSPKEIIRNILLSPTKTIATIFQQRQLIYIFELFFPLGFISILGLPFLLFIAPELTADLLSTNTHPHEIYYQYTATLTPFIFIAAIYGIRFIQTHFPKLPFSLITYYLLFTTLGSAYFFGPLPISNNPNLNMVINPQPYGNIIEDFVQNIPRKFSIATTNNVGAHLSHRQRIFTIPVGIDQADIIIFLLNDPGAQPSLAAQKDMAEKMKHDKNYIEVFKLNDFIVFEKRNLYTHTEPNNQRVKLFPLSIPALQGRDFEGGLIQKESENPSTNSFTSYIASYPSDGLKIFALVNIPKQPMPKNGFPVVIINTGYTQPATYTLETSDKKITDYFAQHGFLVIKPEHRGNGKSDTDTNLPLTLAYPIDVLNLISSIPSLKEADTHNVFLWGHSLGGGVVLTTIAAYDQNPNFTIPVNGAAVWSPITDPLLGYTTLKQLFPNQQIPGSDALQFLGTKPNNTLLWQSVSPLFFVDDIKTPVEIIHGADDDIIPYQWSIEFYDALISNNNKASLKIYPNDDHNFSLSWGNALDENVKFFRSLMK